MNIRSIIVMVTLVFALLLSIVRPAGAQGTATYAQLSSTASQKPSATSPTVVTMDKNDAMKGIKHRVDKNNGDIVIQTPGVYFIVAAAQVGRESGKSDDYVDLWLRVNGKDLAHSNTRQSVDNPKFTAVLVSQTVLVLKANDVIHVMISVSTAGSGLGIIATAPAGEAVIPSVIFSIYRVG